MNRYLVAALAIGAAVLAHAAPASAKLPENCLQRAVDKSEQLVKAMESELAREHRNYENAYNGLYGRWGEFSRYYQGAWVKECLDTYPQHLDAYNKFLAERATPVMHQVRERLIEVCTSYTNENVDKHKAKIDELLAAGRPRDVEGELRRLSNLVTKKKIVTKCKPLAPEIAKITEEYIPSIRNRAAADDASGKTAWAYFRAEQVYRETKEALASRGKNKKEVPAPVATSGQAAADFRRTLQDCIDGVGKLRAAGVGDDYALQNKQHQQPSRLPPGTKWRAPAGPSSATLAEAEALCGEFSSSIDELAEKGRAHNDKLFAAQNKAWVAANVKGAGMKQVYNQNSKRRPSDIENLGSKIVWTYRSYTTGSLMSECKEYVFSKGGALKSRRVYPCSR